ncbi:uncharacterized protein LOC128675309 isoform X2 [Plodia interpunctella]|uniref:uncharacterized protein LOC128675309 isoform X2 n=1 Tax=Plodia interpunctella TaxID=58824 RepID=UPI00236806F1|nr:uncharacterized protein LOC128675309 isoform X2 [Plodia interpunctella]
MFESDDYDQILSQLDFPNLPRQSESKKPEQVNSVLIEKSQTQNVKEKNDHETNSSNTTDSQTVFINNLNPQPRNNSPSIPHSKNCESKKEVSPKHSKRKIIDSHFDYNTKRKFPGPAGLLTGSLQESKDESICQLELFSQDIEFSQNSLKRGLFDLPMWIKLQQDIVQWNLSEVDTIKSIKQKALAGNLRRRKAQTVTAFVETIDRSATDPLIVLRDTTGINIANNSDTLNNEQNLLDDLENIFSDDIF